MKSQVCSKVEHVLVVIKLKFGFTKVRHKGLARNAQRLFVMRAGESAPDSWEAVVSGSGVADGAVAEPRQGKGRGQISQKA